MASWSSLLALAALAACLVLAAGAQPAEANGASGGQGCLAALTFNTIFMPPEAEFLWRVELAGTRNFSCRGGLEFGPALGVAEGRLDDFDCRIWYDSPFIGIAECYEPDSGRAVGRTVLDTTVKGAVFVLPAPNAHEDDAWGRFKVTSTGELAPANYFIRYNTSGGMHPEHCTAKPGEWQLVPFSATYEGYLCQ